MTNNNKINNIFEYLKENVINISSIYKNKKINNSEMLMEHFYYPNMDMNLSNLDNKNLNELKNNIKLLTQVDIKMTNEQLFSVIMNFDMEPVELPTLEDKNNRKTFLSYNVDILTYFELNLKKLRNENKIPVHIINIINDIEINNVLSFIKLFKRIAIQLINEIDLVNKEKCKECKECEKCE